MSKQKTVPFFLVSLSYGCGDGSLPHVDTGALGTHHLAVSCDDSHTGAQRSDNLLTAVFPTGDLGRTVVLCSEP